MSDAVDILARTVWAEARGTGAVGMRHVASVIMNRAAHPRWWGHDVISVCQAPYQFSCWNQSDPNRPKLLAVTEADAWFAIARQIAEDALAGNLADATGGADSYFALSMKHPPSWTARAVHTLSDGWHSFWRVELPAPSGEPEAPVVSVHSHEAEDNVADDLNAAQLKRIRGERTT